MFGGGNKSLVFEIIEASYVCRFADDSMFVATTLPQLSKIIEDLTTSGAQHELQIHPDKTNIMTNLKERNRYYKNNSIDMVGT